MRKIFLLVGALACTSMPAQAQSWLEEFETAEPFATIRRCEQSVLDMDYEDGYAEGKEHAQLFQTALNRKDWNEDEKQYLNTSRFTSRHGMGGMTSGAQLLIGMMFAKLDGEPWRASSPTNACLMGRFAIYRKQAWSAVHSGFTEHLSPELRNLYFSLPTQ